MSLTTWDTETTIRELYKRKASPFREDNWVVVHAFKSAQLDKIHLHYFGKTPPPDGWFAKVLEGTKLLAGFNIKFDVLYAIHNKPLNLEAWMDYVANGGNVWDGQLAEYLLEGMDPAHHMLSLDEVAPRYGGVLKIDEIKALWAAGVSTEDIEPDLVIRYLQGGNDETGQYRDGDIGNTERIAKGQIARAREAGQLRSILLNMGSLLCTIEMERNGMFVDRELGLKLAAELKVKIDDLKVQLEQYLPHNLPFDFKWTSRFHKSALIFGGTVKYGRREYLLQDGTYTFEEGHHLQAYAQKKVQVPVMDAEGWPVFYKSGKNAGEQKFKSETVDDETKPKSRMGEDYFTFPGFTQPKKAWESADPGFYSTASEIIEELGTRNIPFLKAFAALQSATKDLGTYFIVTDPETGESKGMLALVDEHGIIHHKLNHTSTVTARFSSSDPNLQNVPKGKKSKIKLVFVSRFGPDGKIIQSDFTALEIYVQAILTRCDQLIEDLKLGLDMHVLRLSNSPAGEGKTYEELLVLCKGNKSIGLEPVEKWDYARTDSKVYSFQAAYGAGDTKIADTTGMSVDRVAALRAADEARYPEITVYFAERAKEIKSNRRPAGRVVPHPDIPGLMCHLGVSYVKTPDGKMYSYRESPSPEYLAKKGINSSFSPTEIKNYEVQGEGGEWAKAAMWLAVRAFYKRRNFGHLALLVNQVHDALYADAHKDAAFEAAALLHACMEAASDFMEFYFGWTVPVPVPSDTTWGASMMDDVGVPGVTDRAKEFRVELRALYMDGYTPSFLH